jgi:hypothetical protein
MVHQVNGIARPKKGDVEEHIGIIRQYTSDFIDGKIATDSLFKVLQSALHSMNTVLNYSEQSLMGGGSKRRRESVSTSSDSKCTPWQSVLRTNLFQVRTQLGVLKRLERRRVRSVLVVVPAKESVGSWRSVLCTNWF